ncbi:MAG: hypothetical protein U0790_27745 [Isosphaeraceae bacterium]
MSTAGKVLSVLALLLAPVWVLLAAGVAQVNRSGGEAVAKLQADFAKLQEDVKTSKRSLAKLLDDTFLEREKTHDELTVLQVRQTEVEKARAQVLDELSHLKVELESVTQSIEQTKTIIEVRQAELDEETKAKADLEALVEQLKSTNGELRGELTGLTDKFQASLRENKSLVERLLGNGSAVSTRPASLVR